MKQQRGITLIEVLAVLTLLSIISVIIISITINTQNTFKRQQEDNLTTTDMTLLLNSMTSEIRMHPSHVSVGRKELRISPPNEGATVYTFDEGTDTLLRNGVTNGVGISAFDPTLDGDVLTIKLTDPKSKIWSTRIVLRRGNR
ncbi:prepilin-type N-terminal cleavage/methylation domain-containing protein [Psychrobacillus sp. L4]|uniref:prepilin-type N-terminal cleavage/methylation domain-containing protein n=1 Tax=Psychrobacillus sp. L4 TaxID=3236892 RepID=UPI0036F33352